ncbi:uroporphyrinogen decarboxylase family protein [Desulfitibacter alkalitolerans]|uniref:uroporphyrinogen decarboxylase family protein n=1 Tax=Desulfitibacter alkalitolerans TaxID=264641 RepID=UPI0006890DF6|nr:uroporphyrinogen decarboxylase family protein [Desulfitibacter alkalitolerans]
MINRPDKPDFERIKTALYCSEPDRVPLAELIIDPKIKNAYMGKKVEGLKDDVEFWAAAGYDYILLSKGLLEPGHVLEGTSVQKTKTETSLYEDGIEERDWANLHEGVIKTEEDFEKYNWPNPDDLDYSEYEDVKKLLPDNMKVITTSGKIFTCAWMLMGFEHFCMSMYDQPGLVQRLFDKLGEIQFKVLERVLEHTDVVQAVWMPDDIAYAEALMVSPEHLRKYLFPWYKKFSKECKLRSLPFIYHSDGKLWDILDDLVDIGFNAIHPIEPKAMDINQLKDTVNGKLCIMGNLDLGYTLTRGTPEEVIAETKERIAYLAPGGGYCVGASNSVPSYVPIENYKAMVETTFKYGKYPINI